MSQPKVSAEDKAQHIEELVDEWGLGEIRGGLKKLTGWERSSTEARAQRKKLTTAGVAGIIWTRH